jgi:hypothetical protein
MKPAKLLSVLESLHLILREYRTETRKRHSLDYLHFQEKPRLNNGCYTTGKKVIPINAAAIDMSNEEPQ